MRKLSLTLVLCLAGALAAQTTGTTSSSTASTPAQGATDSKDTKKDDKKKYKKKKDDKDKDKKSSGQQDVLDTDKVFNTRVANDVLGQIRDGLEGHSRRLMLSAFDADKMDGYLTFEDQIESYFNRYSAFRVRFQIANVTVEGTKGVVLVDTELEQIPDNGGSPQRKRGQLRFELELGKKGWRVVDFRDRSFFS
jgi:hypothetical protein